MAELERDWSYDDLVDWHSLTNAMEEAQERARREAERDAQMRGR